MAYFTSGPKKPDSDEETNLLWVELVIDLK